MSFLITCSIYPIKNKVVLSEKFGFYLDNPRTESDIELVKELWLEDVGLMRLSSNRCQYYNGKHDARND